VLPIELAIHHVCDYLDELAHVGRWSTWCDAGAQQKSCPVDLRPSSKDGSFGLGSDACDCGVILARPHTAVPFPCEDCALWRGLCLQLPLWSLLIPEGCSHRLRVSDTDSGFRHRLRVLDTD